MPIGLAATFIILAVTVGFFITIYAVIKIESKLLGFQNHELFTNMARVFLIGFLLYILIFIVFLFIGKLFGPSSASEIFLAYGLPITWLFIAPFFLRRAIQSHEGINIGKMKSALIFIGALATGILVWGGLLAAFTHR